MELRAEIGRNTKLDVNKIKKEYKTELSNTINIEKRLGLEQILPPPQKDTNKLTALCKLEKARKEKEELQKSIQQKNAKRMKKIRDLESKHHPVPKNTKTKKSRENKKIIPKTEQEIPYKKTANKSNKYLYNRFSQEFDENVQLIDEEEQGADLLSKDHIRILLVKTGFIGNNIESMPEISLRIKNYTNPKPTTKENTTFFQKKNYLTTVQKKR
jgi:hypothetical protein